MGLLALLIVLFILVGVPIIVVFSVKGSKKNKPPNPNIYQMPYQPQPPSVQQNPNAIEIKQNQLYPYIRKNLLTKNEWFFYKGLHPIAQKYNLHILSKVRVADLVTPQSNLSHSEWHTYFNKIKAKHIDFLLCKPENLYPLLAIELDDGSHSTQDRKDRDILVDKIFEKAGIPLIHTMGTKNLEKSICEKLNLTATNEVETKV